MPTYEYRCNHCNHHFEAFQGIHDAPLRRCPRCKKNGVKRLISAGAGIIFKGSGFYATDYRGRRPGSSSSAATDSKATENAGKAGKDSPSDAAD